MKYSIASLALSAAAATFVFAPANAQQDETSTNETCHVHLFDGSDFESDNIVIQGPGEFDSLKQLPNAGGEDWNDEADSLKVGATATVEAWEEEGFSGESTTYEAGSEHPDISEPSSLKITCE